MTESPDVQWLTIPDLTEMLGLKVSQVRRLIEDRALLASRIDGVWKVPAAFIVDGEPLSELKGTLIVLADSGSAMRKLCVGYFNTDDSLGVSPIAAGRRAAKPRVRARRRRAADLGRVRPSGRKKGDKVLQATRCVTVLGEIEELGTCRWREWGIPHGGPGSSTLCSMIRST